MIQSFLGFNNLNQDQIYTLIHQSLKLKKNKLKIPPTLGTAALLFFEASTRTRFSFQTACVRAGVSPMILDGASGTSLEKGESIEDTIFNIEAMRPLFFVIRCSDNVNLVQLNEKIKTPIINAGWGKIGHPTQALLDIATMFEHWNDLQNKRVLFVGDIRHSRIFNSHRELSQIMGYQLGFCAPPEFTLSETQGLKAFDQVEQGLEWADAVVTLRVQKERHASETNLGDVYRTKYGLNAERAKKLKSKGLILHPGPINYGIEIEKEVLSDPRSVVLSMVENGVFVRETIIQKIISGEWS